MTPKSDIARSLHGFRTLSGTHATAPPGTHGERRAHKQARGHAIGVVETADSLTDVV